MYSISKTALLGLTKVCANELACDGIRVNCVAPGIIRTKFSAAVCFIIFLFSYNLYLMLLKSNIMY